MNRHRRVANYAEMIKEVPLTRRMPPWDPHPDYGESLNPPGLGREESQALLRWGGGGFAAYQRRLAGRPGPAPSGTPKALPNGCPPTPY